jgi:hypothetical protein
LGVKRAARIGVLGLLGVLLLTGCSKADPKATTATTSAVTPTSSTTSSSAGSSPTASSPSASAVPASFNGTCGDLLPVTALDLAISRPIVGQTAFIVGVAEPNIGRVAYLNCRYGVTTALVKKKKVTTTKVEIGISLYKSADQATRRVQGTIDDYRSHGAAPTNVAVGQFPGTVLLGYGDPTVVVGAGPRTVAVSMNAKLVPAGQTSKTLVAMAKAALDATQKFSQGATPTSEATTSGATPSVATPSSTSS